MGSEAKVGVVEKAATLRGPTVEEWRAMTAAERVRFQLEVLDALSNPRKAMAEVRLAQAEREQAQQRAEQAAAERAQALAVAREGIFAVLAGRGVGCPEDARARIASCEDAAALQRWLLRAMSAGSAAEVFSEGRPEGG